MLTAALSLIHNNEGFADTNIGGGSPNPLNDFLKNNIKRRLFKKVLSIKKGGILRVINQHTSHSSHSSHSSHYSSSTGNNGSTSSQDYSTNSVYTAGGVVKDAALYKLGDRTLSLGLFGNDVKELADYLISIKLMKKEMIEKTQGYIKYNKAIEESVKVFQAKNKLRQTGKVDTNLAVMINKKIREQKNTK